MDLLIWLRTIIDDMLRDQPVKCFLDAFQDPEVQVVWDSIARVCLWSL